MMPARKKKQHKMQLLAICQLRSSGAITNMLPKGTILDPEHVSGKSLPTNLRSREWGHRVVTCYVDDEELTVPVRHAGSNANPVLIPITAEQKAADKQAETRKADEQNDQRVRLAERALATAQAEHKATATRLNEAEAAASKLKQEGGS